MQPDQPNFELEVLQTILTVYGGHGIMVPKQNEKIPHFTRGFLLFEGELPYQLLTSDGKLNLVNRQLVPVEKIPLIIADLKAKLSWQEIYIRRNDLLGWTGHYSLITHYKGQQLSNIDKLNLHSSNLTSAIRSPANYDLFFDDDKSRALGVYVL